MVITSIITTTSAAHSTLLLSANTSAGCGSLSVAVTQPFIPELSGLSVVLPGLGCCSFSLTLITGRGGTKRAYGISGTTDIPSLSSTVD